MGATSRTVQQRETADGLGDRQQVRVQRCGKSAPACRATGAAWQTPFGARPSRGDGRLVCPSGHPSGRPHRWMVTAPRKRSTESRLQVDSPSQTPSAVKPGLWASAAAPSAAARSLHFRRGLDLNVPGRAPVVGTIAQASLGATGRVIAQGQHSRRPAPRYPPARMAALAHASEFARTMRYSRGADRI